MLRIQLIIGILCIGLASQSQTLLDIKAKNGDAVYPLLRKYDLLNEQNLESFYCINGLGDKAELLIGKSYKLPILIYTYDNKSIRSTLAIKDKNLAEDIKSYNEKALSGKLRKSTFTKDKQLWVPFDMASAKDQKKHLAHCRKPENTAPIAKVTKASNKKRSSSPAPEKELIADAKLYSVPEYDLAKRPHAINDFEALGKLASVNAPFSSDTDDELDDEAYLKLKFKLISNKTVNYSLFGKDHEEVTIRTDRLADKVYYIVPGHGGPDPGAIAEDVEGKYTMCEDEYAYDVCLRMAKALMEESAIVYIVVQDKNDGIRDDHYLDCDKDERVYGGAVMPASQLARLQQGTNAVNALYAKHKAEGLKDENQVMISVHIDSRSENARQDVFFYYYSENKIEKKLSTNLQKTFAKKYKTYRKDREYTGTISSRPLFVLRKSLPNSVFVELANIRNEADRKRLIYPKNRQLLAEWLAEGLSK